MKSNALKAVLIVILFISFYGCTRMSIDAGNMSQNVYLGGSPETEEYDRVGTFTATAKGSWAFFGLAPLKQPDIEKVLKREISKVGGNGVINLKIVTKQSFLDGLINIVTLGLYTVRRAVISGTVVKFKSDMSAIPETEIFAVRDKQINGTITYSIPGIITPKTLIMGLN